MTTDEDSSDDQDRVVSRRVRHDTTADPGDDAAYRAADPLPDASDGPPTSGQPPAGEASSETAAAELAEENESEPRRSE